MFGKKNEEKKAVKLIKKEYECCQCHKIMGNAYVKPEDSDAFDNSYPMCWPCFLELCDKAAGRKTEKETNE